jgi:hypothetical protein
MRRLDANEIKALVSVALVSITVVLLFVPVAKGADEIRAMFVLLTGIVVYDFIRSVQEDKRVKDIQQAYDPKPAPSTVFDQDDTQVMRR